jgi:ElaB/YqjD/DUF883 family membrane-anchored ribosome-binding protein
MKYLLAVLLLLVPVWAQAQTAEALLSQEKQDLRCTRPDRTLIRKETALGTSWSSETSNSAKYNQQVSGFNDCTRVFVDNANREITRIRDEAGAKLNQIGADATSHIRIIERQINAAIEDAKAVDSLEEPPPSTAAAEPAAFPSPDCKPPDSKLVIPLPHRPDNGARDQKYDGQKLGYATCMRAWIAQAKAEIQQIDHNAHADMRPVTEDANRQIREIKATILATLEETKTAALEQARALDQLKASLAPNSPPPPQPGIESVTVTDTRLLRQQDSPTGAGDPDTIVCRMRQQLPDSRLWGPEICKRNRDWADLYRRGVQISSDGLKLVDSEKQRTYNPQTCVTRVSQTAMGFPLVTSECQGGP